MDGKEDIMFLIGFVLFVILLLVLSHKPGGILGLSNKTNSGATSSLSYTKSGSVAAQKPPVLNKLSNTSGPINTAVTLYGANFIVGHNTVFFGTTTIDAISSDGKTMVFSVPQILPPKCNSTANGCFSPLISQPINTGNYQVYVSNANGQSNFITFKLTAGYSYNGQVSNNPPKIRGIYGVPNVYLNESATWVLEVTTSQADNVIIHVDWGDGSIADRLLPIQRDMIFLYGHSYTKAGSYKISFSLTDDSTGKQVSSASAKVNITSSAFSTPYSSQLNISAIVPSQVKAGDMIALIGTGFSHDNPLIHFGTSTFSISPSNYGTAFYFSVPVKTSLGRYNIYVSNNLGMVSNNSSIKVVN